MTTNTGTPSSMPMKPKNPPPMMMANIIQKPFTPVELPRIFGPRILPSNCCKMRMNTRKMRHFMGSTSKMMKAEGMAPIKGPKKGMTFVTPTMTATSRV